VAVEIWLTNVRHYDVMDEAFRETFPTNPPVREVVGVDSLGRRVTILIPTRQSWIRVECSRQTLL
jgi:enamine deaminase RidA (YjgF/YER057c/UK114 family)